MKKLILLLSILLLNMLSLYSGSPHNEQTHFFNRDHYKKTAEGFRYKEPLPLQKKSKSNPAKIDWEWMRYVSYLIVAGAIIFLIYRLILFAYSPDNKKLKNLPLPVNAIEEEPTIESDLDALLALALNENNFREAIRIHYLLAIRKLNENKIVVYTIDKTNFEYVSEVGRHPAFSLFRELTINFESIWFGDSQADEGKFKQYQNRYTALTEVITLNRTKQADA